MNIRHSVKILYATCVVFAAASSAESESPRAGVDGNSLHREYGALTRKRGWLKRFGLQTNRRPDPEKSAATDVVYTRVSETTIEKLLRELKYAFVKKNFSTTTVYTFRNKHNYQIRLTLLFNQTNIMLAATFPATTLGRINQYNSSRYYVRAVLYTGANNIQETVFESNLMCGEGVSETMIRYFINRYDLDLRHFADKLFNGRQN